MILSYYFIFVIASNCIQQFLKETNGLNYSRRSKTLLCNLSPISQIKHKKMADQTSAISILILTILNNILKRPCRLCLRFKSS